MSHARDITAGLLPLPQQIRSAKHESGPTARSATRVQWSNEQDPLVQAYLERAFGTLDCGEILITVDQMAIDSLPQADMLEGYELELSPQQIHLKADSTWGALHGLTTLKQLMYENTLPRQVHIVDQPRFPWRGLMLDVTRHFIPLPQLLEVVDGLQLLKLNVLHLHLSDDQGFRFGSEAFPKLVSDEHYAKDELRHLVAYAADRGTRVIPEIDVPGHVNHWLLAYPEWGSEQAKPSQRFGVHPGCLDPTQESVYQALETLFAEVAEVFPDRFVHVGGDEANPKWWQRAEHIQAFIAEHDLKDARGLQNYFLCRLQISLAALNKQIIGWDEVLHEQMPDCLVQNWRGATTRDRALAVPRPCIVSAPYYLDLHFPADIHYRFDPTATQQDWLRMEDDLATDLRLEHIAEALSWTHQWRRGAIALDDSEPGAPVLGGEACQWAELVDGPTLPMRLWSRLPAVAERLWSNANCRDVTDFYRRLAGVLGHPELCSDGHQHTCLQQLGLTDQQIQAVQYLEPTKWYSRLLGAQALQARMQGSEMPQARPYTVATPLNKVVDYLMPESFASRGLKDAVIGEHLDELALLCEGAVAEPWPTGDDDVVEGLKANLAAIRLYQQTLAGATGLDEALAGLRTHYRPYGEYMPALIPFLLDHLQTSR